MVRGVYGASYLRIRGDQDVLLVVDGAPIPDDAEAVLATVPLRGVRRVEVLKGASAAAMYGKPWGYSAVILLTTQGAP
jgi:outer membrane receptor protein involved in Fe transport